MHYPLRLLLSAPPWITEPNARDFIQRVEAADGAALEDGIKLAYADFIRGCKADNIWNAIKASCILAGARTLSGALVPLVGTAPTNFNFVSGDYNRKTGLAGNGTTKYLNSNRNNNVDPQNSKHVSVFVTEQTTSGPTNYPQYIGFSSSPGWSTIFRVVSNGNIEMTVNSQTSRASRPSSSGFLGASRNSSTSFTSRAANSNQITAATSAAPANSVFYIYSDLNVNNYSNARLAFYSIGESLDLALLDARVTTLINAIGAAIP